VSHQQEPPAPPDYEPIILPGESLAKYRDRVPAAGAANGSIESSVSAEAASAFDQLFQTPAAELPRETEAPRAEEAVSKPPREAEAPLAVEEARTQAELPAAAPVESPAPPAADLAASTEVFRASEAAEPEVPSFEAPAPRAQAEEGERETPAPTAEAAESVHAEETREAEPEATAEPLEAESALAPEEIGLEAAESPDYGAFLDERIAAAEALEEYGEEEEGETAGEEAAAEAEEASAAEPEATPAGGREGEPEYSARLQDDRRPRFQRPMRRDRRGGRRGVRGRFHHRPQRPKPTQPITELLKPGQEIIVQIAKEPLGKKGARITSHIALPGRFLVYMPTVDHIGVSRKIASAEERARLRRILMEMKGKYGGGFIVRTAAAGMSEEEVRTDVEFLTRTWNEIKQRAEQRKAPAILHRDLNLVERILRDHLSEDYTAIWLDNEEEYTKVVDFVGKFQPRLVNRVKLYTKEAPIFEEFGIQQEIDKSLRPKVWLKSGGYIVINHTEALVAIDVNTGKFVGKGSTRLEDTIVKTNLEAVKEIVRQIRLRDLGGIIVVDFIDMEERKNRDKVMQALEEALRSDRAPSKVLGFNEFGLVAITRKRTKQALERVLCQPCPYCTGSGMVKSIPTICYEIQAEARKMAPEIDSPSLTLRVNPEIGKALKTRESVLIEELEKWTKKSVIIQSDPSLHWEQYDIY
jgi:ribonuclease G